MLNVFYIIFIRKEIFQDVCIVFLYSFIHTPFTCNLWGYKIYPQIFSHFIIFFFIYRHPPILRFFSSFFSSKPSAKKDIVIIMMVKRIIIIQMISGFIYFYLLFFLIFCIFFTEKSFFLHLWRFKTPILNLKNILIL